MTNIFDTHAHYDDEKFDIDRDDLISSLPENGVVGVINCGTDVKTSEKSIDFAKKYPFFYCACGIHPEECEGTNDDDLEKIVELLKYEKCVAVGEIGLDYHWEIDRRKQTEVFEKQLVIAKQFDMPVIIHDREAHGDTLSLLKKYRPRGVMHCFSGSVEMMREILQIGMYVGFGGALTFKNAKKAVECVKECPPDRILTETDCPYMAPQKHRGTRNNSSYIEEVAVKIGEIMGENAQSVLDRCTQNARELFNLKAE